MNRWLAPLAAGYGWAASLRGAGYRRGWLEQKRLNRPVVSIGNLTTGGTGKTPLVAYVAKLFLQRGLRPVILTRGYRRREKSLVAFDPADNSSPDPRKMGDEPALLAAALPAVPVVVCADRFRAGRVAEERFNPDVHLLDDGFQHLRLARDLDLVALDVTQELSDRFLLPAGRLRERCSALRRAHILVLTRVDFNDRDAFATRLKRLGLKAPVFHSRTRLTGFVEIRTGRLLPPDALRGGRLFAFCGIGNPQAFFRDLRRWGLELACERIFRDHHAYSEDDVASIMLSARTSGASALITTEKDAMNVPQALKVRVNAFACVIEAEIVEREDFEKRLMDSLVSCPA